MPRYGITADELHALMIDDLKAYCVHHGLDAKMIARIFLDNDGEAGRPLEQTVRLVIEAFRGRDDEVRCHGEVIIAEMKFIEPKDRK